MKRRKDKNLVKRFIGFECIVMGGILLASCLAIFFIVMNAYANNTTVPSGAVESTLLSTGLATIGMVVSIWTGLNIIQVLEKDKLLELEKEVEAYKRERHILNKRSFLNNILEDQNELNLYIYRKLKESSEQEAEEVSSELYFELNQIEKMFREIYTRRRPVYQSYTDEYYDDIVEKCRKIKDKIKQEMTNPKVYLEYLKIRVLEFEFYKGYTQESKENGEVVSCFTNVIEGFTKIFKGLSEPEKLVKKRYYLDKDISLTIYMLNTLGEAYSKIIETYADDGEVTDEMRTLAKQAKKYFVALEALLESDEIKNNEELKRNIREVYYRNYGCALERISRKIEKSVETEFVYGGTIYEMYKKAVDVVLNGYEVGSKQQPFYTYLSFYVKVMNNYDIKNGERTTAHKAYTQEALFYAEIAEKNFPTVLHFIKFRAYIERDLAIGAIGEKTENDCNAAFIYYNRSKEIVKRIEASENKNNAIRK